MKECKRLLSFVLCLVMVLGMFPAGILTAQAAEGDTIYVLAGGDFQEAGDHANSAANVTNILAQVSQKYQTMDGFLFIGDYDCETHDSATETANGITALMVAVQGSYSNLNDANSVLVQGNHDYMDSRIDTTGGHEFDGYSAYVLNEDDYPNGGGSQSGIQTLANDLKSWLNNKIGEGYSAPIFIVSHLPLAYTPRTVTQGDAKYAKYIFDVLNDAGKNGLNIIFLHGHDHAYGPDNYMGGEAIYLPVGDKICIAEAGSTSAWTEETLNFTYMNAGYTGYYSDAYTYVTTAGTDKLTMTVFAITDEQVTVERYSEDGLYNLKTAGYDGSYSNTSVDNVSLGLPKYEAVYASPQTIALTEAEEYGDIGSWVGIAAETPADDVTTSNKGWVELIAPVPDTPAVPGTPESTKYVYTLDTDGTVTDKADAAQGYLIVGSNNASAMTDSLGATGVTITDNAITLDAQPDYEWWITSDGKITDGTNYLVFNGNSSASGGTLTTTTTAGSASTWTIRHNGSGDYSVYVTHTYEERVIFWTETRTEYCFLRYNSNAFTYGTNSSSSNTSYTVRLFSGAEVYTPATEGTPAVPGTNGTYGKIAGDLTYNATAGLTADEAMALVKGGIDGYYYDAMSTPGSDVTGTKVDDSVLTWEWVDTFDGNTAGDYEVAIKYGDFLLGTAEVVVPASTTYYAAEGNGLYLVDMNTSADNAMAAVKAGVTVYSATDASGSNKSAISDSDVTWNWVDTYNGADSGPYTVEILKDGYSLGTVEVKVNIQYETGINSNWTYIGESEATGGTHTYTLDENGVEYGSDNKYLIVGYLQTSTSDNYDYALTPNGTATAPVKISISGKTATVDTRDYEWYFDNTKNTGSSTYNTVITQNGSTWIYHQDHNIKIGVDNKGYWNIAHQGDGSYRIKDYDNSDWYLRYSTSGSKFTVKNAGSTDDYEVRLYKYTGTTGGTPGGPIYALIEGNTVYTVAQGSSATKALAAVKAGITGYTATAEDGTGKTEIADSDLKWTWKNTFNGNSTGSYWVEISYQGKVLGTVEVKVEPGTVNNYPEYPDEGSVKVNKTGTGIDFQSSGIAQVEVSASGVPIKKGADVIVMLDTSSSMTSWCICGTQNCNSNGSSHKRRSVVLEESFKNLITQFKTPGDDGQLLDLRVAIADFNGFYSSGAYARDSADTMSDDISYSATSEAQVYTGDGTLGAGAFISVEDLAASYTLNYTSGTNYDYAFDAIYQMGTAIKEANTEERDLYVIFMSDGAAMQWNYYHSQGNSDLWGEWITGTWSASELTTANLNCTTHAYYYDEVDHNGDGNLNEHRMANAIKGDPSEKYEVIRKTDTLGTPTGEANMYMVPGLGAKMFSIAFDPRADGNVEAHYMTTSIATLASEQTGTTQYYYEVSSASELSNAFTAIGSEIAYAAYNARFVDQMGDDYDLQMAASTYSVVDGSTTTNKTITPKIEIISYDIYTRQDYLNGTITEDKIGDRKGTYTVLETVTFNADGTEAYSDQIGGGTTNILADGTQSGYVKGVIYAKTFLYNTNATAVAVEGVSIPTGTKSDGTTTGSTNLLPSETFYWKMGTVQTSELAMRYYVYLEGSMQGTREGGSYPTNEYATLYYDNYLNNPCKKDTVSPVLAWKEANVSYAFYLVDENGNIIVNQTTGQTGSFANKIAVTNPVVYETVLLNSDEEVSSIDIASLGVLPEGYTLYDYDGTNGATYTVTINSNTTGSWEITSVKDVATTYVTQYSPTNASAYSNDKKHNTVGDDYTHTVVWFAVLWKIQALPDTVVIDYGLPVDISVLRNDMFGDNGKLAGVGAYSDSLNLDGHDTALASGFGTSYTGTYGTARADATTGKVRYTVKDMQMNGYEKFAYAVNYTGNENAGYYYDTVTVIPATTIYYEDDFVTYDGFSWDYTNNAWADNDALWAIEGTEADALQDEDRPGQYSLTDANNIYGYDSAYTTMSQFSLGSARKLHVNYDQYGTFQFTFYGTGFDLISMTSGETGGITMDVYKGTATSGDSNLATYVDEEGNTHTHQYTVDTYFGYECVDGEWVITDSANPNALYQVPVMEVADLTYGQYTVVVKASYAPLFDHGQYGTNDANTGKGAYDFYLDAIRIYDPANDGAVDDDTVIEDAYKADGEGWPSYIELRNKLIDTNTLGNASTATKVEGLVFIDGNASVGDTAIKDYISYGPNNEVYLAPGQRVAFLLSTPDNIANVHIGISSADGRTGTYTITNIARQDIVENNTVKAKAGAYYGAKTSTIDTTTDMYYDLTGWKGDIIVISNTGDKYNTTGIISLTNIKSTYNSDPNATETTEAQTYGLRNASLELAAAEDQSYGLMTASEDAAAETTVPETVVEEEVKDELFETYIYMTPAAAALVVESLNADAEPEIPEETVPETTVPEETEPEETVPETTVPEETEPEPTVPEETEPEDFEPAYVNVKLNKTTIKVGQKVLVTVTTSADVDYVIINDTVVTTYSTGSTGNRIWKRNVTGTAVGTMDIEVVCCNAGDVAAEPIVHTVTVQRKTWFDLIYDLFD